MKILLVEDSPSMRSMLASILEAESDDPGLEVIEASSGFEALKVLPHHQFDAIVTDINMPDINGLELVSFLKNHATYQDIPVMVVSTESSAEDRRRAQELGAHDYLVKPFEPGELAEKIRKLLQART